MKLSVLTTPCFFPGGVVGRWRFPPIRDLRPEVNRRSPIVRILCEKSRQKNINRYTDQSISPTDIDDADRCTLKIFTRSCIMEIKRAGYAIGSILGSWSGGCRAAGFSAYLSIKRKKRYRFRRQNFARSWSPSEIQETKAAGNCQLI